MLRLKKQVRNEPGRPLEPFNVYLGRDRRLQSHMALEENQANDVLLSGSIRGSQGACKGQSFGESLVMAEDLVN